MTPGAAPCAAQRSRGAPVPRLLLCLLVAALPLGAAAAMATGAVASPGTPAARHLAAELLILRGDLRRLDEKPGLPPANRLGLRERVTSELGLLPWLMREAGDAAGAARLRRWQQRSLDDEAARRRLTQVVVAAVLRHPFDASAFLTPAPTVARLRQARAIDNAYCAACHRGTGEGMAEAVLPARDLALMARREPESEFLARLVLGVRGDETIGFANPLTDAEIGAMLVMFRSAGAPRSRVPG